MTAFSFIKFMIVFRCCSFKFFEGIIMAKKKDKKVYAPKVGDVVSFGYCSSCSLMPCFAVVVNEAFFKFFATVYMKSVFETHKNLNSGHEPIFLLRVDNAVNEFGNQALTASFAFPSAVAYRVKFLYSIFDDKERLAVEKIFEAFNDVFAVEPNRNVSIYSNVFASLKRISEDVKTQEEFSDGDIRLEIMYYQFIKFLIDHNPKKGERHDEEKKEICN